MAVGIKVAVIRSMSKSLVVVEVVIRLPIKVVDDVLVEGSMHQITKHPSVQLCVFGFLSLAAVMLPRLVIALQGRESIG